MAMDTTSFHSQIKFDSELYFKKGLFNFGSKLTSYWSAKISSVSALEGTIPSCTIPYGSQATQLGVYAHESLTLH